MHFSRLLIVTTLLLLAVSCKKAPDAGTEKPAPAGEAQNQQQPPAEATPRTAPPEPGPRHAAPAPPPGVNTPPPPPTIPLSEIPLDDPSCEAKKEKQDREFRREKLPRLHEEEQALAVLDQWLRRTSDVLSLQENDRLLTKLSAAGKEVLGCQTSFDDRLFKLMTMVALPPGGNGERYPLYFCEGALQHDYQEWCGAVLLRLGQWELLDAIWTEGNAAAQYCDEGLYDSKAGSSASELAARLGQFAKCQAVLSGEECTASGLAASVKDNLEEMTSYCKAIKARSTLENCEGKVGSEATSCALAMYINRQGTGRGCQQLNRLAGTAVPHIFCLQPDAFAEVDCDSFLEGLPAPEFGDLHTQSCQLAGRARNHDQDCGKELAGTPAGLMYNAYVASIPSAEESPLMAQRVEKVPLTRPWAETLLAIKGLQLASAKPIPEIFGDKEGDGPRRPQREGGPPPGVRGKEEGPPPLDAGPRSHEHKLLPDLWGFAGKEAQNSPNGFQPGPEHGPPPAGRPHGPPPEGLLPGSARDKFDDGFGEPPAEVVPGAGQPAGMLPPVEFAPGAAPPGSVLPSPKDFVPRPPEGFEAAGPGNQQLPEKFASRLVVTQFTHPLTVSGGPLQKAMARFVRATLVLPGAFHGRGSVPCDGLVAESLLLPAPGSLSEVRIRAMNVSKEDLRCEFNVLVEGPSGKAEKRRTVDVRSGGIVPLNITFEAMEQAHSEVTHACVAVKLPPKETPEVVEDLPAS